MNRKFDQKPNRNIKKSGDKESNKSFSKVPEKFVVDQRMFRCPVCRGKLSVNSSGSFVCKKKHCFDLAAKGYVNFITSQSAHPNKYDKNLFECRNRIFSAGFYDPVLFALRSAIVDFTQERPLAVLDVGCGEGFYANWLAKNCPQANLFGLDIVKEAIQIACREAGDVKWIVGNLADIPLFNGTFDVLLNILTPANYKEFRRLLKGDGVLIKVVPGSRYLQEVRHCVSEQLVNKDYRNDLTVDYFMENMELLEKRTVCYTLPVTEEQARLFLQMTPMTFHVDTESLDAQRIAEIREMTIHLELLIGKAKDQ